MQAYARGLIGLAIAGAVIAVGAAGRVQAGVLLVKGSSVRENALPPLVPMPDGTVVSASDIVVRSWRVDLGDDDVLVYNVADGSVARYGDANTLSLAAFGMAFGTSVMIADPRTLTFSTLASQEMLLGAILDQPGFVVMVDVGPATVPASVLSLGADDLHTPTPLGPPTPTRTATPTGVATNTIAPTVNDHGHRPTEPDANEPR